MGTLTKMALSFIGHNKPSRATGRSLAPALALPTPQRSGGMPLMQAFSERRSRREFATAPLADQVLSNVLWAAFGVNRNDGKGRTAPSARNAQEIDVYAALPGGLYLYDAGTHSLVLVARVDARKVTGYQDFVDEAPLDLVYVADHAHMTGGSAEQRLAFSAVCVGAIVENVYLYCASEGLATVVRGWLDSQALARALQLSGDEHVIAAQTVGYAPG